MPNYRRPRVTGARIFFTVALQEPGSDLLVREVELLRQAVRSTRAERPFGIDAWVVLPDHLHCVWALPAGDGDFATRWPLNHIRDGADWEAHVRCCRINPVKHGLVERPEDWPWSWLHRDSG